jgi:hypothetical protein
MPYEPFYSAMTEQAENLAFEHLCAIRGDIAELKKDVRLFREELRNFTNELHIMQDEALRSKQSKDSQT